MGFCRLWALPSAIMSVVDGSDGMVCSSAAMVSSLAKGSTCTMYPPADRTSRSRSMLTPTAIALFTQGQGRAYRVRGGLTG
jgi:hypothetical protein